MLILFSSFLIVTLANQKKKLQHQKDIQSLREHQQNQLIEAAVRSEELERHRIAETLHDEVGAILSSTKLHLQGIPTLLKRNCNFFIEAKNYSTKAFKKCVASHTTFIPIF
jgi:two-component system NarL family sensor kinase